MITYMIIMYVPSINGSINAGVIAIFPGLSLNAQSPSQQRNNMREQGRTLVKRTIYCHFLL